MLENGIIFGRNAVFELFDSDISVNSLYIAENSPIKGRALALAKKKGCSMQGTEDPAVDHLMVLANI